jgi:hypothetical protein
VRSPEDVLLARTRKKPDSYSPSGISDVSNQTKTELCAIRVILVGLTHFRL